jgi:hypothetical protein
VSGYPHDLAGEDAPPPVDVAPRTFEMAVRAAAARRAEQPDVELLEAAPRRLAVSLEVLLVEVDAAAPKRSKASDGTYGDAAHAARWEDSDHNAWLIHKGVGVCRARDITNDPAVRLAAAFERLRALAHAGKLPQVLNGGYAILNGRITREDWSGWKTYTGPNPHVVEGHVSVSLNPAQFDSRAPWGIFAPAAAPTPPRPAPAKWTGPDLRGTGTGLRGDQGNNGPRVKAWQEWLNRYYPAYSKLSTDGVWGEKTTAVNRAFGRRSGIPSADGRNIGPALAAAYWRAGLFRPLSAAQHRAIGHVRRDDRR